MSQQERTESEKAKAPALRPIPSDLEKLVEKLEAQDEMDPLISHRSSPRGSQRGHHSSRKGSATDEADLPEVKDSLIAQFFHTRTYEYIMMTVILLNCVSIVLQIEYPDMLIPAQWLVVNLIFFFIYVAEIALKSFAFGFGTYIQLRWHQFDLFVTLLAAIQISSYYAIIDSKLMSEYNKYVSGDMVQILRLFRLLRLARIFPELAILLQAFVASMKALAWILIMAVIWFYLCACAATVFIGRKEWLPTEANPEEPEDIKDVREAFATIPLSMFALFEVMTLEGWCDYVRPLLEARPVIVFAFLLFIFVSAFFMLNLVTAVVVDRTLTAQKEAKEETSEDAERLEKEQMDVLYEVLLQCNKGEDTMPKEFFFDCLRKSEITERLVRLGWNRDFMISTFELIDHDNDGQASLLRLRKLWIACHMPLDTQNFVRFQINLARRMEYTDKVAFTVVDAISKISGKEFRLSDEAKAKPSFLSSVGPKVAT